MRDVGADSFAVESPVPCDVGTRQEFVFTSPNWDIGTAVRFAESIGYRGLYSIEVSQHPAIRIVHNTILANLS